MTSGAESHTSSFVRGSGLLDRVDYRLLETPEEKDAVYLMRYRAYLHGGLIAPSESLRVYDSYDDAPNAWLFGIYVDGELCSSLRLHVLTSEWRTSYATELFGDVLHPRLDRGEVFIDPARFTGDPEKSLRFQELPYVTLRLVFLACEYFNADTGLALVRPEHQVFYRRICMYETIAEPRPFPNVSKKTALMASDFRNVREKILTRFPIMRSSAFERRMLFDRTDLRQAMPRPTLVPARERVSGGRA
ncbi:N-acyl amino acid synthase FeeM domain-containing protein [Bradyrhizobium sp.]|uniref:N-acyl amino acid synthase FeeM domain-containing protein n=1 Tax=Bradyrhizobium sp. TaxID=376 RepID=UPI0025C362F5|nr:hypothetical protein [Bradyrhizobium sp.]MBV8920380.1 hypothetical protein [Bradyrhizobium sp.]